MASRSGGSLRGRAHITQQSIKKLEYQSHINSLAIAEAEATHGVAIHRAKALDRKLDRLQLSVEEYIGKRTSLKPRKQFLSDAFCFLLSFFLLTQPFCCCFASHSLATIRRIFGARIPKGEVDLFGEPVQGHRARS